jgi:hypothetical protein
MVANVRLHIDNEFVFDINDVRADITVSFIQNSREFISKNIVGFSSVLQLPMVHNTVLNVGGYHYNITNL